MVIKICLETSYKIYIIKSLILHQKNNAIVDSIIKNVRNIFRLKKGYKAIKDIIISDIRTLFKSEKEDYYKPKNCGCF